jgi:DNA-binding NarL/FixJ family response regulator
MKSLRVLVVNDSVEFLAAVASVLRVHPQLELVGYARSGREALVQVAQLRPDLVLMDVVMPEMNGLDATRHLKAQPGAPRVIMLTLYDEEEYRVAAAAAGADGFIGKTEFGTQLPPLIRALYPY